MPILLTLFEAIPEKLLKLTAETPIPTLTQLSPADRAFLKRMNAQLTEFLQTINDYFPEQKSHLSNVLTQVIAPEIYDRIQDIVYKLYRSNWLNNATPMPALPIIHSAFIKRETIKDKRELSLSDEKRILENELDVEIRNHRKALDSEIAEVTEMIDAANEIKRTQNLAGIFAYISDDILKTIDSDPIPALKDLTIEQQNKIHQFGSELTLFIQTIPSLVKNAVNADSLMMIMAEVVNSPALAPMQNKIQQLFKTRWFGVGIEQAALTTMLTAFMLRNEITVKRQKSLLETKSDLELARDQASNPKPEIAAIQAQLAQVQEWINVASLIQCMEELPSASHQIPEHKLISRFEKKLQNKIASLDEHTKKTDKTENYIADQQSKKIHLQALLKQIRLYRFNAISLDELIERVQSFQESTAHFTHTNSFKIFANRHINNLFAIETKELLDDFYKDLVKAQAKTQRLH